ncbi:21325_t:CDS:2 [Dentiscutata erythropus]|uniref:21325_t:CDS:1 n=1 Tax=Dentiscutata erythropus TaxID=1348616 RepID=A0A9N8ZEC7_9GLOM|nr:21325_t:CDS:2 [Dentiscutata erythropus]
MPAHITVHENLDERLDSNKPFCFNAEDEENEIIVILGSFFEKSQEDKNGASSSVLMKSINENINVFSLGVQNPLLNIATIEQPHLNVFVYLCLDSALWHLAKINYKYGEISSRNYINRNHADSVDFITDVDKFQIVYFEGSRPAEKKPEKEITNAKKLFCNLKNLYSNIEMEVTNTRRCLPKKLFMFGGQSF